MKLHQIHWHQFNVHVCSIHRFAASEGSRDGRRPALHGGEESVEDPLSGEEGVVRRQLVRHRPRLTDRPYLKGNKGKVKTSQYV